MTEKSVSMHQLLSAAKVVEDRKLTLAICSELKWLWAGVQHGQVQGSWHRHRSPVLFVIVNNICFFSIRIGHEWASSHSSSFSSHLGCLKRKVICRNRWQPLNCVQSMKAGSDMWGFICAICILGVYGK